MAKKKSKAGAPLGNKNAEKWTEETVMPKLEEIKKLARDPFCNSLVRALSSLGLYGQLWSDWKRKFKGNKIVSESIKRIDAHFESKLVEGGLSGDLNTTMTIFLLKNNYNYTDRQQVESTVREIELTEEEMRESIDRYLKIADYD